MATPAGKPALERRHVRNWKRYALTLSALGTVSGAAALWLAASEPGPGGDAPYHLWMAIPLAMLAAASFAAASLCFILRE